MNTAHFFLSAWVLSPVGLFIAAASLFLYFRAYGWNERAGWMVLAAAVLLFTVMSPLATLADGYLFSAHTVQHIILMLAVPAFALMALPRNVRLPGRITRLLHPAVCWACGIGAMWAWHAPALCNAAATSHTVSAIQTVTLLGLGGVFWWQLLAPSESQRISPLSGALYLFAACLGCTVLGIILTFSPITVCSAYVHPVDRLAIEPMIWSWGMTPIRDQQIGGLTMWVPMCLVYMGAIFGQLARWWGAPASGAPSYARS